MMVIDETALRPEASGTACDIDHDGDLDIISVGWYNPKVWVYENLQATSR